LDRKEHGDNPRLRPGREKKEIHPAIRFLQYSNKAVFVLRLSWISNTFDFVFEKIRLDLNTNMKIAFFFQPFSIC